VPSYVFLSAGEPLNGCGNGAPNAWNASPDNPIATGPNGEKTGGYLGLDNGLLCWAQSTMGSTFDTYAALFALTRLGADGAQGALSCQPSSTAPKPTDGTTYSSGCPRLSNPVQTPITLVAQ